MKKEELENNFSYHQPNDEQASLYHVIRETAKNFAELLNDLCPESREKSLAITKLEESVMWANASIARKI